MDHFGIGADIAGVSNVYFQLSRGAGRTTYLLESVKDGDRVVFLTEREGRRFKSLCKERGVDVEIVVNNGREIEKLFHCPAPHGDQRTIFDHSWVENFYANAILRATQDLDRLQEDLSGKGAIHRETERHAKESLRWEFKEQTR